MVTKKEEKETLKHKIFYGFAVGFVVLLVGSYKSMRSLSGSTDWDIAQITAIFLSGVVGGIGGIIIYLTYCYIRDLYTSFKEKHFK